MRTNVVIPKSQRALVLQGGGALGAYEVGVLKILCKKLPKRHGVDGKDEPLFDIIAGSSIGAINAAVLVSNVVNRNKTWEKAVEQLEIFWTDMKDGLSSAPDFGKWWWRGQSEKISEIQIKPEVEEAAIKYYSVKEYLKHGTPNVCSPPSVRGDDKFGDQVDNLWLLHSSKPLEDTIVRHSKDKSKDENKEKLTIHTSWNDKQPRLLVICVDVAEGKTVTFDSYHTNSGCENSLYDGDGINIDHIMASGTIPEFYEYRDIKGHKFFDGGFLSNTPFRELIQSHQDYWLKIIGEDKHKKKIPNLEVYIINVHPSKQSPVIDNDHDVIKERINDITFFDRSSHYDENLAYVQTDYSTILEKLVELAIKYVNPNKRYEFDNKYKEFLTEEAKSKSNSNKSRTYTDLLNGRFNITKVTRIENTGYDNSISLKAADFTAKSIKNLIIKGEADALNWFNNLNDENKD